jgi:broad specificity phosphatase PhoE
VSSTDEDQRPAVTTLIAVRHGQSTANAAFLQAEATGGDVVGLDGYRDADIPLSRLGQHQAVAFGRWLRRQPATDVAYCSPYQRAQQTWHLAAQELSTEHRPTVVVDERLRDREMGVLELLTPGSIRREHPEEARRRATVGELYYRPPGGESMADVALRLRSFLRDMPTGRVLLVAHDAVVLMLRYLTEALTETNLLRIPPVANASVTQWVATNGTWRLDRYNDVGHLDAADPSHTG